MTLQGNMLLKVGVPVLLLAMGLVVIKGCSDGGGNEKGGAQSTQNEGYTLTREEMDALGISGDSAKDTVATLVGKMNVWQRQRQRDQARLEQLIEENQRITRQAADVDSVVEAGSEKNVDVRKRYVSVASNRWSNASNSA